MKTIVIFTRTIDPEGYPFADAYHWNAYLELLLALKSRGVEAYFATGEATYLGEGVFAEAYTADAKVPVADFRRVKQVKAGLVMEKGGFTGQDVLVINPTFVHDITSDKAETYRHFARYQPLSFICEHPAALNEAFDQITTDLVVVKQLVSNRGEGVVIGPKSELRVKVPPVFPVMVQEFIDTSIGIKNYVEGVHDVRVKIGGTIFGGMIRTPASGELRANVAQGGSARHLLPADIPPEATRLALEIDHFFEAYPRYYALDFANTPTGWKLIELNAKPGFSPQSAGEAALHVTHQLADYLLKLCP